jgi:hypothetical protein
MTRPKSSVCEEMQIGRASGDTPVGASPGLLAEEVSALRKLARHRRAASFALFRKTLRLAQALRSDAEGRAD